MARTAGYGPRSVPAVDEHRVVGLEGDVVVRRDEWGIPHVRGERARDAFFGQGFVQAQDRLGQLEYDRRRARGRWAEVVGPTAVAFDVFARRCGLGPAAAREADALAPEPREVLDAFAAGVNAFLELGGPLPPDLARAEVRPEPWTAADCCAVFLVRHVVFANWQRKLWRGRLAAAMGVEAVARIEGVEPRDVPLIVPPAELFRTRDDAHAAVEAMGPVLDAMAELGEPSTGSNSWALHGARTASGLPLVAGDPHRFLEVPNVYYQCHLVCDAFDAIGLSFVGVPGLPHFGHNAHVAWCVTNGNGDYQDLFVERVPPGQAPLRTETVEVRGGEPVAVACHETARGPVVFGDPARGPCLVLRSTALTEPSTGLAVLGPMLAATDVDGLEAVMEGWVDPVNNLVSADVHGDISYRTVGRIPVRDASNAWGPVPGWTDRHDWYGVVAYDDLPRVRNPPGGVIVTANQRIVDDEYPHYLGLDYAHPDRAARVLERLGSLERATVDDMADVHRDRRSLAADVWVPRILAVDPGDEWERVALEALRDWDRWMLPESRGAAVYMTVRDAACRIIAHHPALASVRTPLPDEPTATFVPLELRVWALATGLLAADDRTLVADPAGWGGLLTAALADGVAVLRGGLGDDVAAWRWGTLHRARPRHPLGHVHPDWAAALDPPAVEVGGESDTVMSAGHPVGHGFTVTGTSVARYVFDCADWDASRWVVPLGASGDPTSPHFSDQQATWAAGELLPMRYSWASIEASTTTATVLRPT